MNVRKVKMQAFAVACRPINPPNHFGEDHLIILFAARPWHRELSHNRSLDLLCARSGKATVTFQETDEHRWHEVFYFDRLSIGFCIERRIIDQGLVKVREDVKRQLDRNTIG